MKICRSGLKAVEGFDWLTFKQVLTRSPKKVLQIREERLYFVRARTWATRTEYFPVDLFFSVRSIWYGASFLRRATIDENLNKKHFKHKLK